MLLATTRTLGVGGGRLHLGLAALGPSSVLHSATGRAGPALGPPVRAGVRRGGTGAVALLLGVQIVDRAEFELPCRTRPLGVGQSLGLLALHEGRIRQRLRLAIRLALLTQLPVQLGLRQVRGIGQRLLLTVATRLLGRLLIRLRRTRRLLRLTSSLSSRRTILLTLLTQLPERLSLRRIPGVRLRLLLAITRLLDPVTVRLRRTRRLPRLTSSLSLRTQIPLQLTLRTQIPVYLTLRRVHRVRPRLLLAITRLLDPVTVRLRRTRRLPRLTSSLSLRT
ncbi:hypothetical protein ACFV84_25845, partial [Kitasatospora sp. NPDC059811]|uniref:hypothetical protein n=1 Tax=Kitasatospora sp. NPDC059811 TaxID=3346957 RepID=UPI0036573608